MSITCGIKGFRAYVERQPTGAIVGRAMSYFACPVANYLQDQGAYHAEVAQANYIISYYADPITSHYKREGRRTPAKVARFIKYLDRMATKRNNYDMTREDVLAVLDVFVA